MSPGWQEHDYGLMRKGLGTFACLVGPRIDDEVEGYMRAEWKRGFETCKDP